MPIVNPYAKKKKSSTSLERHSKPLMVAATTSKDPTAPTVVITPNSALNKTKPDVGNTSQRRPRPPLTSPKPPPPLSSNAPPVPRRLLTPSGNNASSKMVPAKKTSTSTSSIKTKTKTSLKAQLKQQIQELKRKKKLEKERKLMEKRLKEREAEQKRQEVEREKLRQEYEIKKREGDKRKEEERLVRERERHRLEVERKEQREKKIAEREAKEQERERIRQEKQKQREIEYQQRLQAYQQRQMRQYGFVPNTLLHHSTSQQIPYQVPSIYAPTTPHQQSMSVAASPQTAATVLASFTQCGSQHGMGQHGIGSNVGPIPALNQQVILPCINCPLGSASNRTSSSVAPTNAPLDSSENSLSLLHSPPTPTTPSTNHQQMSNLLATSLIPTPPKKNHSQQSFPGMQPFTPQYSSYPTGPVHRLAPYGVVGPSFAVRPSMHNTTTTPVMTGAIPNILQMPSASLVHRWMAPARPPRPTPPKILTLHPLQPPSPYSEFELLPQKIIVVKECNASFGVSVEIKTQSVLVDPDVWEVLMNNKPPPAVTPVAKLTAIVNNSDTSISKTAAAAGSTSPTKVVANSSDGSTEIMAVDLSSASISTSSLKTTEKSMGPEADAHVGALKSDVEVVSIIAGNSSSTNPEEKGVSSTDITPAFESPPIASIGTTCVDETASRANLSALQEMQATGLKETTMNNRAAKNNEEKIEVVPTLPGKRAETTMEQTTTLQEGRVVAQKLVQGSKPAIVDTSIAAKAVADTVRPVQIATPIATTPAVQPTQQRRKRRKRATFHVMSVMDAVKQNEKNPETDLDKKLKPGDLILEINGESTCGLPFYKACQLFSTCKAPARNSIVGSETNKQALIECSLLVARRRPKVQAPTPPTSLLYKPIKTTFSINTNSVVKGDFSVDETRGLLDIVIKTLVHNSRPLGYEASTEFIFQCMATSSLLVRDHSCIQRKLTHLQNSIDTTSSVVASAYWKQQWEANCNDVKIPEALKLDFMTLAQLSAIRALPRPARGCRCGGSDHDYVDSPKCILYHSLRKASGKSAADSLLKKKVGLETSLRDLRAMETAFKDRIVKMKDEQDQELAEAKFVDEMEKNQTCQRKQAIFAPNFCTMVLCAIAAVGPTFNVPGNSSPSPETVKITEKKLHDEDPDDDDLPLLALGKRPTNDAMGSAAKKVKTETPAASFGFHPAFLAQLLVYMSQTWGHVYRESSHSDYTWRWEVHHGQTSDAAPKREKSKNPRGPGTLTLANIQFFLQDDVMSRLEEVSIDGLNSCRGNEAEKNKQKLCVEEMIRLALLISPKKTGLLDEMKALLQLGIVRKSRQGAVVLSKEWFTRVDPLILDDMDAKWSFEADPDNKYLVNSKVKRELANYWIRVDGAWALNEDLSEVVFLDNEWDEWRRSFEDEVEKRADDEDGIGKFGI